MPKTYRLLEAFWPKKLCTRRCSGYDFCAPFFTTPRNTFNHIIQTRKAKSIGSTWIKHWSDTISRFRPMALFWYTVHNRIVFFRCASQKLFGVPLANENHVFSFDFSESGHASNYQYDVSVSFISLFRNCLISISKKTPPLKRCAKRMPSSSSLPSAPRTT